LEVLLTITSGTLIHGISGCYAATTNFLSKQDTLSFQKLVLHHALVALQATSESHFKICSFIVNLISNVSYVLQQLQRSTDVNKILLARGNIAFMIPQKLEIIITHEVATIMELMASYDVRSSCTI
jgi:hypothetical protein